MFSRLQYASKSESPLAMTFVKRRSACFAADRSAGIRQHSVPCPEQSCVFELTRNTVTAKEQSRLRLELPVRQDRLGLVVPVSALGVSIDDLPLGVWVGRVGELDVVGYDGDRVGIGREDFGENGAYDGRHAAAFISRAFENGDPGGQYS
jgi:hypothetical protein